MHLDIIEKKISTVLIRLRYVLTRSAHLVVGPSLSLDQRLGIHCRLTSVIRRVVTSVLDVQWKHFCRAMLVSSAAIAVMRCLSVGLCVTFVHSVITNKNIFKMFSQSCSPTILVVAYQTAWQHSDGNPLTGASNAGGVG